MEPAQKAAQQILTVIESTYQPSHDYVTVQAHAFAHLDLAFYENTSRRLGEYGFRTLADLEDRTISATPGTVLARVMVRTLLSRDGTVMASLYHPRIKRVWMRCMLWVLRILPGKVVDMETECSDGSFVATSNAMGAALGLPPLISMEYMPAKTTALDIYERHTSRVAAHLKARDGVTVRVMADQQDLIASQNRMNALKAAFRGEIGGITKAELDQLAVLGKSITTDVHNAIRQEQLKRAS
jgi:hypothetical protein